MLYLYDAVASRQWGPIEADAPYAEQFVEFRGRCYRVVDVKVVKGKVVVILGLTLRKLPVVARWTEDDVIPARVKDSK